MEETTIRCEQASELELALEHAGAFGQAKGGKTLLPEHMLAIDPNDLDSVLAVVGAIPGDIMACVIDAWLCGD